MLVVVMVVVMVVVAVCVAEHCAPPVSLGEQLAAWEATKTGQAARAVALRCPRAAEGGGGVGVDGKAARACLESVRWRIRCARGAGPQQVPDRLSADELGVAHVGCRGSKARRCARQTADRAGKTCLRGSPRSPTHRAAHPERLAHPRWHPFARASRGQVVAR